MFVQSPPSVMWGSILFLFVLLLALAWLGVWIASIVWVYRDATRRNQPGWIVVLLAALLFWPISLLVWLLLRDRMGKPVPVAAGTPPPAAVTTGACPQCGTALAVGVRGLCPACLLQQGFATGTVPAATDRGQPAPSVAEMAPLFPNLEIVELLGQGGMGAVYKARQPTLDRWVALKVLTPAAGRDPGFAERFSREARALARLHHPGIVGVHDFGEVQGRFYFIMEYVDGVNLRRMEQERRLAPREALSVATQVCDALQYAHDEGIVHRDIKPENILIDRKGRVKIADFGLAKLIGQEAPGATLTVAGQFMGTPHYMAPEQVEHPKDVDHRADIYSLGVVLYEMLTGELPLGRFPAPSQRVQIDVRLDEVVLRTLEKEPGRRYQQAGEVKTQVETIAGTEGGGQRPEVRGQSRRTVSQFVSAQKSPPPEGWPQAGVGVPARLSRTAVIGACWAPLFFMVFVGMFWALKGVPAGEYHGPAWWQQLLAFTLLPLGVAAPFGATILGWIAVAQIRRSEGRLYGLGLALFDGLLFPLLALDWLLAWVCLTAARSFVDFYVNFSNLNDPHVHLPLATRMANLLAKHSELAMVGAVVMAIAVDFFIIRAAWRAARKAIGDRAQVPPTLAPSGPKANAPGAGDPMFFGNLALVLVVAGLFAPIFGETGLGFGCVAFILALVFGILGWKRLTGKVAVILVVFVTVLFGSFSWWRAVQFRAMSRNVMEKFEAEHKQRNADNKSDSNKAILRKNYAVHAVIIEAPETLLDELNIAWLLDSSGIRIVSNDSGAIPKLMSSPQARTTEFPIVPVNVGEQVRIDRQKPVKYPAAYGNDGIPMKYETRSVGRLIEIKLNSMTNGMADISYHMEDVAEPIWREIGIGNTRTVKQPFFSTRSVDSSVEVSLQHWAITGGCKETMKDGGKVILIFGIQVEEVAMRHPPSLMRPCMVPVDHRSGLTQQRLYVKLGV